MVASKVVMSAGSLAGPLAVAKVWWLVGRWAAATAESLVAVRAGQWAAYLAALMAE